ncbi:hypothetical protein [Paenibacillus oleatilyticus]|uniref:hypothetical protein n=1 Tax=Paenibacillus oleatilyticus TaxID=2594886 RepID=UPI001C1FC322|nr:hypothetical protein [Paenibacillus oleatilyticus]MBU7316027.1 hypothetical protein [Paenibacillus oleatilyticus]
MKIKLEQPILIGSKEDICFMIVEFIEIDQLMADTQISYYGKVYNYDEFTPENERDGQWVTIYH